MRTMRASLVLIGLLFIALEGASAQRITDRVVAVTDGDTLEVARGRARVTVRIHGVDAPEGKQPYGPEATAALKGFVLNRVVKVNIRDVDLYGRLVADVSVNDRDVGEALVRAGAAWHFARYSNSDRLANAEVDARAARRGLWALRNPLPPWDFRDADPGRLPLAAATNGPYHGNRESKVFHAAGCQHYKCKNCTVLFQSISQAKSAGFRPHEQCIK